MTRTFYIKPGKTEVMLDFKEKNEELGVSYSATITAMMDLFISSKDFRNEVLENLN
jgi:hypothetical protein|tara:strand:+ start:721 stop:888 length:168 start_codon:yes stop_codon:yes gene_type:complete